jgi:hypothetical protein
LCVITNAEKGTSGLVKAALLNALQTTEKKIKKLWSVLNLRHTQLELTYLMMICVKTT